MALIADLVVDLRANTARFERDMRKAETTMGKVQASTRLVDREFQSLGRRLGGFRSLVGAALGASGLGLMIKQSVAAADAIGKTADKLGVSTNALQVYRFQAERTGVSQQALEMGLQRLGRRLGEIAVTGKGTAKDALDAIGVSALDAAGNARRLEEIIPEISDALAGMTNRQEQLAVIQKLVDSEGVALINTWGKGSKALEQMEAQAFATGQVMQESTIRKAEQAADRIGILEKAIKNQLTVAFVDLAPELENFIGLALKGVEKTVLFANAVAHLARQVFGLRKETAQMTLGELNIERGDLQAELTRGARLTGRNAMSPQRRDELQNRLAEVDATIARIEKLNGGIDETLAGLALVAGNGAPGASGGAGGAGGPSGGGLGGVADAAEKAANRYENFIKQMESGNKVLAVEAKGQTLAAKQLEERIKASEILGRKLLPQEIKRIDELVAAREELNSTIAAQADAERAAQEAARKAADEALRRAEDAARQAEQQAERIRQPFENAAENIQRDFADSFSSIFRDGLDGFKGFADRVKDIFINLAGEIAALLVFSPAARSTLVSGGLGGLFSVMSGGANAAGPLLNASNGGFSLMGLASAPFNLASDAFRYIGGGLGNLGFTGAQRWIAENLVTGLNQVNPLTAGLAGFGGGFAANKVFGGGVGTSIGSTAGTLIGSAFGPVGSFVGSFLGGGIGSLFGGKSKPGRPRFGANLNLSTGAFQSFTRDHVKDDFIDGVGQVAQAAVAQANVLLASLGLAPVAGNLQFGTFQGRAAFALPGEQFGATGGAFEQLRGLLDPKFANVAGRTFGTVGGRTSTPSQATYEAFSAGLTEALVRKAAQDAGGQFARIAGLSTSGADLEKNLGFLAQYNALAADSSVTMSEALSTIEMHFDTLENQALALGLALGPVTAARERELEALRLQAGYSSVDELLFGLTAGPNAIIDPVTALSNALTRFDSLVNAALGKDLTAIPQVSGAAANVLGLTETVFASGTTAQELQQAVIDALVAVSESGPGTSPEDLPDATASASASLAELRRITDLLEQLTEQGQLAAVNS